MHGRHRYFNGDFYVLIRVSLLRYPMHAKKKFLNQSHEVHAPLIVWQSHLNENFAFNIAELFP